MAERDKYRDFHREGQRVVMRLLQDELWEMRGPEDWEHVLRTFTDGLQALRIPGEGCCIHWLDPSGDPPLILGQYVWRDNRWFQSLAGRDRAAVVGIWTAGLPDCRADLAEDDPYHQSSLMESRFGFPVRAALDVPFANGVLSLVSSKAAVFTELDVDLVRDLVEGLAILFYRLRGFENSRVKDECLQRVQQLEMIGQLAAETVHEVNNSFMIILGQCQLLLMADLPPEIREVVEIIYSAGESTKNLQTRLLRLARREVEHRVVDLNRLVVESLQLLRRQLRKDKIDLTEEMYPQLPMIQASAGQIQQVIVNLVQNSRDALVEQRSSGRIRITTKAEKGRVRLSVEDDGPGIPDGLQDQIFEPFFTTKESGRGTGLGLSVCQSIAQNHGGYLYVEPRSRGAMIVLDLPTADHLSLSAAN